MPKAGEIKKNSAIEYEGGVYFVKDIERSVPQGRAGGSLYRMRLYDVVTGYKIDQTFKDSDMLNLADLVRRPATFSYSDGEEYVFMDSEDYTQYSLNGEAIADELLFINEETQGLMVILVSDAPVALDLPPTVDRRNRPVGKGWLGHCPHQTGQTHHRPGGAGARAYFHGRPH